MKVLFSSCYPDETFFKLIREKINISQPAQKFNKLLVKGCCLNGLDVEVAVAYAGGHKALYEEIATEVYSGHTITYKFCNLEGNYFKRARKKRGFVKQIVDDFAKQSPDGLLMIDSLSPIALDLSKEAKKHGLKVITHITDFLEFLLPETKNPLFYIKNNLLIQRFYRQFDYTDMFVLLTEAMKDKLEIGKRSYLVMDGICDYELMEGPKTEKINSDRDIKIFLYSGALCYKYGLKNLVDGFLKADCQKSELHLYGDGDYVQELKDVCKRNPRVKYFGVVPNEEMIIKQKEATFLVNPRPTKDEYTKYSFPSKNIEYMVSGRPVISTKLPCMTKEYDPYVYYFDEDTVDGIEKGIKSCCQLEDGCVSDKGLSAKAFILEQKNNAAQIKRFLTRINEV